jgi:hypothetical protein
MGFKKPTMFISKVDSHTKDKKFHLHGFGFEQLPSYYNNNNNNVYKCAI